MKKIFLYRLFKESKIFFVFTVLFILGYTIVLSKQMDMLFFPFNSMFSSNTAKDFSTSTYGVKLNGSIVKITEDPYLKKDFSENSLQIFSKWIKSDGKDLMTGLIEKRMKDSTKKAFFFTRLTPSKETIYTWPIWFVQFHNMQAREGDIIEIWEYKLDLIKDKFVIQDSSLVTKQTVINE